MCRAVAGGVPGRDHFETLRSLRDTRGNGVNKRGTMTANSQTTIQEPITLTGVGVHGGETATVVLHPAPVDNGITFLKVDESCGEEVEVRAHVNNVVGTSLSTVFGAGEAGQIATVEHLLGALGGLEIDNVVIELVGNEVPIMDGSAGAFVEAIQQAGIKRQSSRRRFIKIVQPLRVTFDGMIGELFPYEGRRFEVDIDFSSDIIGRQAYVYDFDDGDFGDDVARARTFGFMSDVETLWANGFALGASLDNTVVVRDDIVINPEGLRFADEFVRHKVLDAVGDLTLAGAPILGRYRSQRGGHRLNCAVVRALLESRDAWTWSDGAGPRDTAQVEVDAKMPAAAFGPDVS